MTSCIWKNNHKWAQWVLCHLVKVEFFFFFNFPLSWRDVRVSRADFQFLFDVSISRGCLLNIFHLCLFAAYFHTCFSSQTCSSFFLFVIFSPSPVLCIFPSSFCSANCLNSTTCSRTENLKLACNFLTLLWLGWIQVTSRWKFGSGMHWTMYLNYYALLTGHASLVLFSKYI